MVFIGQWHEPQKSRVRKQPINLRASLMGYSVQIVLQDQ